jgi:hypothetical protein
MDLLPTAQQLGCTVAQLAIGETVYLHWILQALLPPP